MAALQIDCEAVGKSWLGPSPRSHHTMSFDAARNTTVLFGGFRDVFLGDTWEWDGQLWLQRPMPGPSPRIGHATAYDSSHGMTVLFGGGADGETWEGTFPCDAILRFNVVVHETGDGCRILAKALTTLPEGNPLRICFDNATQCACQAALVNRHGRAKATCETRVKGDHYVCLTDCAEMCRKRLCPAP